MPCNKNTPKCKFKKGEELIPDCCRQHLEETLVYVVGLLEKHGITYWLDWGALLGYHRDGHLIDWDYDIDLGIMIGDVPRVKKLHDRITRDSFFPMFTPPGNPRLWVYYSKKNAIGLEFFEHTIKNNRVEYVHPEWIRPRGFLKKFIDPVVLSDFAVGGKRVFVPNNIGGVLAARYGNWERVERY